MFCVLPQIPRLFLAANSQVVLGSLSQLVKRGKDGTTVVEKTTRKTAVADTWTTGESHGISGRVSLRDGDDGRWGDGRSMTKIDGF